MKPRLLIPFAALALFVAPPLYVAPPVATAEHFSNIGPEWRCRFPRRDRSFCRMFPNFSLRHDICNPPPDVVGNIEWCREDITVTERKPCGGFETYEAVVVTYRPVYSNGAWGRKYKRTFRKEPTVIVEPPKIYK